MTRDSARPAEAPLLTPIDVAEMFGVPIATLYAWRYRGVGPVSIRVGRHLRYRRADVELWLAGQAGTSNTNTNSE